MTELELRGKIIELDINSTTKLEVEVIDNGNFLRRTIKFNFYHNTNSPAISNEAIGAAQEIFIGSNEFAPVPNGINISSIITINIVSY
jgi:hypothetical protein